MTSTATHWMNIRDGKIEGWADGFPAHELQENQIALTPEEYKLIYSVWGDLDKAKSLIRSIEKKIRGHK